MDYCIWPKVGTIEQFIDANKIGGAQPGTAAEIWSRAEKRAAIPVIWVDQNQSTILYMTPTQEELSHCMEKNNTQALLVFLFPIELVKSLFPYISL